MSWPGQEITFNHDNQILGISCRSVPDGVITTFNRNGKNVNRVFTDQTLCKYIGTDTYCSFNYAARQLNESVTQSDFNHEILKNDIPMENIKSRLEDIAKVIPTGSKVIDGWRQMKCVLAAASTLLTEYDWSEHGSTSKDLVNRNESVREYMEHALDEISNGCSSLPDQKAARFFRNEINIYTPLMGDRNYTTCYGIIPSACEKCDNSVEDISWGPCLFWIFVIVLAILLIIAWFRGFRFNRPIDY